MSFLAVPLDCLEMLAKVPKQCFFQDRCFFLILSIFQPFPLSETEFSVALGLSLL
jgi:hypothetical protein